MNFEERKEQIRAIFKAKGISEEYLEVPWIMETLIVENDSTLNNSLKRSNATGENFTFVKLADKQLIVGKMKDGSYRIILKYVTKGDKNEDIELEETINLDQYGFEQRRVCRLKGEKILQLESLANGTLRATNYRDNRLFQECIFLNSGNCFGVCDDNIMGELVIINDCINSRCSFRSVDYREYEKSYNEKKRELLEKYPNSQKYYTQLDEQIKATLTMMGYYDILMYGYKNRKNNSGLSKQTLPNSLVTSGEDVNGINEISIPHKNSWRTRAKNDAHSLSIYTRFEDPTQ